MFRGWFIIYAWLCLLICWAEPAAGQSNVPGSTRLPAVIIHNAEQFNCHLDQIALNMQEKTLCVFKHEGLINAHTIKERSVWYDYGNAYKATIYPQQIAEFTFQYKDNTRLLAAHFNPALRPSLSAREQQALDTAQQLVALWIRPGMSETDKLRALHDGIINRSRYTKEPMGNVCDLLLEGRGTCEAYSRTLWLFCRMIGLPCHIVYGHAKEPHAWNLVRIGKRWHHVDATWDDPVNEDAPHLNTLSHRYFMLDDAQLSKDHSWSMGNLPAAASKNAVFFRKNNLYFTDDAALWAVLANAITQGHGSIEVYMAHYESDDSLRRRLQAASYQIPALQAVTAWHGPAPQQSGVVHFIFENAGTPQPADMSHLDFSRGIMVETRRLIDNISHTDLQKTWEEISNTATTWWEQFLEWLQALWEWVLNLFCEQEQP